MDRLQREANDATLFRVDAETLNRCLTEIESFTNNLHSIYGALRQYKAGLKNMEKKKAKKMRAHLVERIPPGENFVDILKKFKLAVNLLACLENHIQTPSSEQLCRLLLRALILILDVCKMAHGDIAFRVVSPLFTDKAKVLIDRSGDDRQKAAVQSLGAAWNDSDTEWTHGTVSVFTPVFADGFRPYRNNGETAQNVGDSQLRTQPPPEATFVESQVKTDVGTDLEAERARMERQEKMLQEEAKKIEAEARKLQLEKENLVEAKAALERAVEIDSIRRGGSSASSPQYAASSYSSPRVRRPQIQARRGSDVVYLVQPPIDYNFESTDTDEPPRQRFYLAELIRKGANIVQVMFTLAGDNPNQLAVSKHEYLEVLNNEKMWWQCRNAAGKSGFVPSTILSPLDMIKSEERSARSEGPSDAENIQSSSSPSAGPEPSRRQFEFERGQKGRAMEGQKSRHDYRMVEDESGERYQWNSDMLMKEQVPPYIRERIGKRGWSYLPSPNATP